MRSIQSLGQTRLFRWDIAPFLHHWLLHLPRVSPGPGTDLLGDIHTLLLGLQLRHQLGHVLAGTLRLQRTLLLRGILDDSSGFVIAFLRSLCKSTACWRTELPGFLGTPGDGRVLLDILLGNRAHLLGPLAALGVGGVATGLILTLLLVHSFTFHHIIFNIMFFLLGPALALVLCPADLRSLDVAVLDQWSSAHLDSFVEGDLLVLNEAALPVVLIALLLLLGLVVGDVCGVAPLVVGVVTLHYVVIHSLLNHLNLFNAPFSITSWV